jgi:excinuclease ABC subunit B
LLVFVDESHVTVPQLGGMYRGDFRQATRRIRLPPRLAWTTARCGSRNGTRCAADHQASATPGPWDLDQAGVCRAGDPPDRLIDPLVDVARAQVDDLVGEVRQVAAALSRAGHRAHQAHGGRPHRIFARQGIRVRRSDIDAGAIEIIRDLRLGASTLVGINLLREGLTFECALVAILDADRKAFALGDVAHPDHRPRRPQH